MKRKAFIIFKHTLAVFLSFSLEVKVRAVDLPAQYSPIQYSIESQKGTIEVEKQADGTLDIQTFKQATLKVQYMKAAVSLKENTFVTVGKKFQVHFGTVFIQSKNNDAFYIQTKHGVVKSTKDSVFIIAVNKDKTILSVLMGQAHLNDRINKKDLTVHAGYKLWLGGLEASGKKTVGVFEPIDADLVAEDYRRYVNQSAEEKEVAIDYIKVSWKKAVEQIAEQSQQDVSKGLAGFKKWEDENKQRDLASEKRRRRIKEHFRAHALDLPDQNTEDPLE